MTAMREEMRSHRELARLAARQHGVVSARQLRRLGFSGAAIGRWSRAGRLHRVHRSVYAVGHPRLSDHGRCLAAVLACGRGAVLSHASAAWLWGLLPNCPKTVHVTVPSHGQRHPGIELHHSSTLSTEEWGRMQRIPVTERLGKLDLAEIDAMLLRCKGGRGAARLRRALEIYRDPVFSRARSERLFLALCKKAGLAKPRINTWVGKFEIDAYWEAERFAVEVDGWDAHRTRKAFESDLLRQEEMKLAGIDSVHVSARRIERAPRQVGRRLTILLARRRSELSLPN